MLHAISFNLHGFKTAGRLKDSIPIISHLSKPLTKIKKETHPQR